MESPNTTTKTFMTSDGFTYYDATMEGKVALITGGASGIGKASALAFARKKAKVIVADINEEGAKKVVDEIKAEKGEASFLKVDVTSPEEVQKMVESAVSIYGAIHYAHNNVGIEGERSLLHKSSVDNFDHIMKIDCKSVFLCMKYELIQMTKQQESNTQTKITPCAIVNTASIAGLRGMPEFSAYCAAKHAIVGLTKTAAFEYAKKHIRVNGVAPGTVRTAFLDRFTERWPEYQADSNLVIPMERAATPDEIAQSVVWLCSPDASYVTGHIMVLDGGRTCV